MLTRLPGDVICGSLFPLLSVRDLQSLDTAYTNKDLRPHLRRLWTLYNYDNIDDDISVSDMYWLHCAGVKLLSVLFGGRGQEVHFDVLSFFSDITTINRLVIKRNALKLNEYDDFLRCVAKNCAHLEVLRLDQGPFSDEGLIAVAQNCHQLHTISWKCANSGAVLQALCDNCPYLRHIHCDNLSDTSLISIARTFPHVQSITISGYDVTDAGLLAIADKCHELRAVILDCGDISSSGLAALWATNPNITDVDISGNELITDDDIILLLQCCSQLQALNLDGCRSITDAAVIAVAEHCPQLTLFRFGCCYNVTDDALIALGQHCHKLKSIAISFIMNISDVGISALAAGCPLLQEFAAVETNITDTGMLAIVRGCSDLRNVDLRYCQSLCGNTISALDLHCPLISDLNMFGCRDDIF